ncbi:alpha/beta hydrolase [Calidifontibacter terrae]
MSLTGSTLPLLLALAALILFAALVIGFPRLRNRWAAGGVRAGLALLLNASVVTLAFVMLNDQYAFYVSWSDLAGYQSPAVQVRHGGSAHDANVAKVVGVGFNQWHTPAHLPKLPDPGQRMQRYVVSGRVSGFHSAVWVYLPKGYNSASAQTYPVIMALHGFPGGPGSMNHYGILQAFDEMVAQHRLVPSIMVIPQIDDPVPLDTECVNVPGGPQAESWLAQDVPSWAISHFRVETKRTSWAAWGFSYGGWCAALLGFRHPDIFGASVALQGYFRPSFSTDYEPFKPGSAAYEQYDLVKIARQHPPALNLWLMASKEDSLSYPSTDALVKDARRPLSVTALLLKQGGHTVSVWGPKIGPSFAWLAQAMPGFDPLAPALAAPYHAKVPPARHRR